MVDLLLAGLHRTYTSAPVEHTLQSMDTDYAHFDEDLKDMKKCGKGVHAVVDGRAIEKGETLIWIANGGTLEMKD
ncbi:unnamed protein product [Dovyalis caffra]|uniref:Uncharacterized protein n=1 Tax=Dovyalis caffra TaxID=77055 RepID=A0AAV1QSW6_9ROSI|nr:unnamed protein product [Dovyalis caffra]